MSPATPQAPSRRATIIAAVCVFVGLGLIGGALAFVKSEQLEHAAAEQAHGFEPPQATEIVEVRKILWRPEADLVGTVMALRSVVASNELPGTIAKVHFDSGAIVEPGEVLVTLDDSTERADLAAAEAAVRVAEASLGVAEARLALAKSEAARLQKALDAHAATELEQERMNSELASAEAERERLLAEVDLARARVKQVQTRLDKMVIKAPFRARAGLRTVHDGQYLAEGTEIVRLEEVADTIHLDFAIPQEHLPRVQPGVTVMGTSEAFAEEPFQIKVVAVDARVNNDTRNVRVRAEVDNRADRLRPGMFVRIRVPVDAPSERFVVPATAVRRTPYADQVFVVVEAEDGSLRAKQRFVKLGPAVDGDVIVLEGISLGEKVAASGSFKLRDGALVAAVPPAEPKEAEATAAARRGGGPAQP